MYYSLHYYAHIMTNSLGDKLKSSGVKKSIYISEIGHFGGPNLALPIICFASGGMIFLIYITVYITKLASSCKKNLGKNKSSKDIVHN